MDTIFNQIKDIYDKGDDNVRREIQGHIRDLQVDFYSDWDIFMRLASGVSFPSRRSKAGQRLI